MKWLDPITIMLAFLALVAVITAFVLTTKGVVL